MPVISYEQEMEGEDSEDDDQDGSMDVDKVNEDGAA